MQPSEHQKGFAATLQTLKKLRTPGMRCAAELEMHHYYIVECSFSLIEESNKWKQVTLGKEKMTLPYDVPVLDLLLAPAQICYNCTGIDKPYFIRKYMIN